MKWAEQQRHLFITEHLKENGFINRSDLMEKFKISIAQASIDFRKWKQNNPGKIEFNPKVKRYEVI